MATVTLTSPTAGVIGTGSPSSVTITITCSSAATAAWVEDDVKGTVYKTSSDGGLTTSNGGLTWTGTWSASGGNYPLRAKATIGGVTVSAASQVIGSVRESTLAPAAEITYFDSTSTDFGGWEIGYDSSIGTGLPGTDTTHAGDNWPYGYLFDGGRTHAVSNYNVGSFPTEPSIVMVTSPLKSGWARSVQIKIWYGIGSYFGNPPQDDGGGGTHIDAAWIVPGDNPGGGNGIEAATWGAAGSPYPSNYKRGQSRAAKLPTRADVIGRETFESWSVYLDPDTTTYTYDDLFYCGSPDFHGNYRAPNVSYLGLKVTNRRWSFTARGSNTPGFPSPWKQVDFPFTDDGSYTEYWPYVGSGDPALTSINSSDPSRGGKWTQATTGVWYDFILNVRWSDTNGFLELWCQKNDGGYVNVIPRYRTSTLYTAMVNGVPTTCEILPYYGLYRHRSDSSQKPCRVYMGGKMGTFVSFENAKVSSGAQIGLPAAPATGSAPVNTVAPTVVGTAQVGRTLTANEGTWDNSPSSFTYQWSRSNGGAYSNISGATSRTLVLVTGDIGYTFKVAVVATNSVGSSAASTSAASQSVTAAPAQSTIGNAVIGGFSDNGGGTAVAVSGPYTLNNTSYVTKLTGYVAGSNLGASKIRAVIYKDTGSGQPGPLIVATPPVTFGVSQAAAWVDFPVGSDTFPLQPGDYWLGYWFEQGWQLEYYASVASAGRYILATYSDTANPPAFSASPTNLNFRYSIYATFGPFVTIPQNQTLPSHTGSLTVGTSRTVTPGTWSDATTLTYQWYRADDASGTSAAAIGSATATTYTETSSDIGKYLAVVETSTNSAGATSATSTYVGPVAAAASSGGSRPAATRVAGTRVAGTRVAGTRSS